MLDIFFLLKLNILFARSRLVPEIDKPKVVSQSQSQKLPTWFTLKSQCFEPDLDPKIAPTGEKNYPEGPKKVQRRPKLWPNQKKI